jgi:hypothetical protein
MNYSIPELLLVPAGAPEGLAEAARAFQVRVLDNQTQFAVAYKETLGYSKKARVTTDSIRAMFPKQAKNKDGHVSACIESVHEGAGGYPHFKHNGKTWKAHRLAAFIQTGVWNDEHGEEASHICANNKCCNPEHLCWETPNLNKSRYFCQIFHEHEDHACLHKPQCLY